MGKRNSILTVFNRQQWGKTRGHTGILCIDWSWRDFQYWGHNSKTNDPFRARFQTVITPRAFDGVTLRAHLWGKLFSFKKSKEPVKIREDQEEGGGCVIVALQWRKQNVVFVFLLTAHRVGSVQKVTLQVLVGQKNKFPKKANQFKLKE